MPARRKTITEVQAEMPDEILVLKYENAHSMTVKYECGHVGSGVEAGNLRRGHRCGQCYGSKRKTIPEVQAEMPDEILVLKYEGIQAVTVLGTCGHVRTAEWSDLREGSRCGKCYGNAPKGVLEYQAEFDDLLVLKVENTDAVTVKGACSHVWTTTASRLRKGSRCAKCASYGYNPGKPAWLYFMERPGEMQVGITNHPDQRLATHAREGWQLVEMDGPHCGQEIVDREAAIRKHLKTNNLLVEGKKENWLTSVWSPHSLAAIEDAARQLVAA